MSAVIENGISSEFSTSAIPVADNTTSTETFRREIDLGEGGKQVFEADSLEALTDKLVEAQRNATLKIREQSKRLRAQPERLETEPVRVSRKERTADEKLQLAQRFQNDPDSVLDELLESRFGLKPEQIGEYVQAAQTQATINAIDTAFLQDNTEFHPSPNNAVAITNFLKSEDLPYTKANLDYAFQELSDSGLLETKPDATATQVSDETDQRIVVKEHTRQKSQSTGIRNSQIASNRSIEEIAPGATEDADVQKILAEPDLDKARSLMLAAMQKGRKK